VVDVMERILLVFVPAIFACHKPKPESHTLLFALSVFAIVPLAALLSHATESVAAKTGDVARIDEILPCSPITARWQCVSSPGSAYFVQWSGRCPRRSGWNPHTSYSGWPGYHH